MNKINAIYVVDFTASGATRHSLVGGKGANLGLLTQAGFQVPPGFTVTTDAVAEFLAATRIGEDIQARVAKLNYDEADALEAGTAEIRSLIIGAKIPESVASKIETAYRSLGDQPHVAVRSSGTAEDLSGTSFAGLHDTYLDIKGSDALLQAIKRCWASIWSARATAYRQNNRFDQSKVQMAVVVQIMVESEVSGVMFTGNPRTTATDEIVINASWGLGESVVSGIVTPDEYTVESSTLRALERTLGSKKLQIVRDTASDRGTVQQHVPEAKRAVLCLSDEQLADLARVGQRIQAHYDQIPQDVEWGMAEGRLYVLQSRPITGVEFSWDTEVDAADYPHLSIDHEDVWTRMFSDAFNTGAVSPLTYSARYQTIGGAPDGFCQRVAARIPELRKARPFKFWKGELYYSTRWEEKFIEHSCPPFIRPYIMDWTNPAHREDILKAPFDYERYTQYLIQELVLEPELGPVGFPKHLQQYWREKMFNETGGLSKQELRRLPDAQLKPYIERHLAIENAFVREIGFAYWYRDIFAVLSWMIDTWYDGDNRAALSQLFSGTPEKTDTQIENEDLWEFTERIRNSKTLLSAFKGSNGDAARFFASLEDSDEGRAWLADYQPWALKYEHRGSAERDLIYPKRGDDPHVDYKVFQIFLNNERPIPPQVMERQTKERQRAAYEDVLANIRHKPRGDLKSAAFKAVFDLYGQWTVVRDNERQSPNDRNLYQFKRGFEEMGRRLLERGLIEKEDDYHFLAKQELYDLWDNHVTNMQLLKAKIAGRRHDGQRMMEGKRPPKYLYRNQGIDLDPTADHGDGCFRGRAMNHGIVTGTARVVPNLAGISKVKPGEILVTNATDPGWTPVFLMLSAIVTETGGLMSHASCLSREYGFPSVQLDSAMALIPDGATITVNGDSGEVTIVHANGAQTRDDSESLETIAAVRARSWDDVGAKGEARK